MYEDPEGNVESVFSVFIGVIAIILELFNPIIAGVVGIVALTLGLKGFARTASALSMLGSIMGFFTTLYFVFSLF